MLTESPEVSLSTNPDRVLMVIPQLGAGEARELAYFAVREAQQKMPKMTGGAASRLQPIYGYGYFGIYFPDRYVWFQDHGIQPFTMRALAGKIIPMWIDDPTGSEALKNPKAKTRTTASGKQQILIFRRAAKMGQRKTKRVYNKATKTWDIKSVPMSYPGAPGRIATREAGKPLTTPGRVAGAVARGNVGVRWRHPGLTSRLFLNNALTIACQYGGILPVRVYNADSRWRSQLKVT